MKIFVNKFIFIAITLLTIASCGQYEKNDNKATENNSLENRNDKPRQKANHPWTESVTKKAEKAILTSIENIDKNPLYKGDFPTDIYNMPFTRKKKTEFVVIGYETGTNEPSIYRIDFHPVNEYKSGPRYTVEINIKTEKAIRVYMTPDA